MVNQQLLDYIKQQLQQGVSREIITNNLISQGWQQSDVNDAFSQATGQNISMQGSANFDTGDASKNGKATTGLVMGIIGLIAWFIPIIGAPITIIGLIFGIKGLKSLKRGVAITGIVLCSIGLLATIVNASMGAYHGVTGQNYFNKFFNQGGQELESGGQPAPQQAQQQITPQSPTPDTLEKQAYSNTQYGFKISAPKGWRVDDSGQFGTLVFFLNTQTDQEGENPFSANISIISESAQGYDLDSYVSVTKDLLLKLLQNYKSTDNRKVTVSGTQAQIIGGTVVQGVFHSRNLQLIVIKDGQAYVVTGTVLESTWNQYKDLIESSLLTFELN